MKTIILCHPYSKSFCHAIVDKLIQKYSDFKIIDLYKDQFNPVFSLKELSTYNTGIINDPLVIKYQKILKETTNLIIVTPIWWNSIPSILKGFFDKVFSKNFAYSETNMGIIKGNLNNIQKCLVITTSKSPIIYLKVNGINHVIKMTLKQIGIKNIKFIQFGSINKTNSQQRTNFLNSLSI